MKKIITLMLSLLMVLALAACSSDKENSTGNNSEELSAFAKGLQEKADPRYNICTEADTTVVKQSGNYVFFFMYSAQELDVDDNNWGETYSKAFLDNVSLNDCEKIANEIINSSLEDMNLVGMEVSEGFLNGFSMEVTGFKSGYVFSPMIGAIPFIAYVFEI